MTASSTLDDCETTGVARLRRETHARMLDNGLFTRPGRARLPDGIGLRDLGPDSTGFLPVLTPTRPPRDSPGPALEALFDHPSNVGSPPTELISMPDLPQPKRCHQRRTTRADGSSI